MLNQLANHRKNSPRVTRGGALAAVTFVLFSPAIGSAAEQFELRVPGRPEVVSTVVKSHSVLTVTAPDGQRFRYIRNPQQDSADGLYQAFFSAEVGRFVRWPAVDAGPLYIRDVPAGVWRRSRMRVHRVAAPPVVGPQPVVPVVVPVVSPYFAPVVLLPAGGQSIVRREVVANRPLNPARVVLRNTHSEQLVVKLFDRLNASGAREVSLNPGEARVVLIQRDAGATIEETYEEFHPFLGWRVETRVTAVPPKVRYDVVVWANRTTYRFINRVNGRKSGLTDFSRNSLVSIGAFELPAGELVTDGQRIDVHRTAVSNRNPGAAALFDQPVDF